MTVVDEFEEEFKKFLDCKYAVACNSGTAALHTAVFSLGLQPGDKVITTPFTFLATSNAILYCGGTPIFADIDPETYLIDPLEIEKKLEENPDIVGIICVHLFGQVCDMDSILKIAKDYGIWLVEDTAQALGAEYKGKKAGTFGDFGTYSFYATKNLPTFEGGMVTTNNRTLEQRARIFINQGQIAKYRHVWLGYNYRMPWIIALLGSNYLKLHKKAIISELGVYGIKDGHYPYVAYEQPLYQKLGIEGDCPVAERIAKRVRVNWRRR